VTTTEAGPTTPTTDVPEAGAPNAPVPDRPKKSPGGFARRLPYALAVIALALGFAIGHNANNPQPKSVAQPNLVSADQLNQALAPSNGHTFTNDRGFSALENGVQHSHGIDLPVTPAQRAELARQMDLSRETALKYPTLASAEAAGMTRQGPFSPGLGTHLINPADYAYFAGDGPITDDQIRHPLAWIYDGTKPDSKVVGLFYSSFSKDPQGFAGPNDIWHVHTNICLVSRPDGSSDAPLGADKSVTKAQCDSIGGNLMEKTPLLVHVWTVPGYEDSQGVFGHLNPAVTCNDGSYHVIDPMKIGHKVTTCVDGSE
jgi:hypothetical protein